MKKAELREQNDRLRETLRQVGNAAADIHRLICRQTGHETPDDAILRLLAKTERLEQRVRDLE